MTSSYTHRDATQYKSAGFSHTPLAIAMGLILAGSSPLACAGAPPAPGSAIGSNLLIDPSGAYVNAPKVATDRIGNSVIVWPQATGGGHQGVFALPVRRDSVGGSSPTAFQVVDTDKSGAPGDPVVAMDAKGDFVVAWTDAAAGHSDLDVYVQAYDYNKTTHDYTTNGAVKRLTYTGGTQTVDSIAMDAAGDFVVSWISHTGAYAGNEVYAWSYQHDGTAISAKIHVNTSTSGNQYASSVAMDAAGNFVVVWQSDAVPANGFDIYARRFLRDGTPQDKTAFLVNTHTSGGQVAPAVAVDAAGNFVVTWEGRGPHATSSDIFARRFDKNGDPLPIDGMTSDAKINQHTDGGQSSAAVAMDAVGDFVIAWIYASSTGADIALRRYSASGVAYDTSDVYVNTHTSGYQSSPAVAMDAGGDFIAVWADADQTKYVAQPYQRETPIDLKAALAVAPHGTINPGANLTLTASLSNQQAAVTPSRIAAVDQAITGAWKLRGVVTLPSGVQYKNATCGAHWVCPPTVSGQTLTFDYDAALMAATVSSNITIAVTAPSTKGTALTFKNYVYGAQPDTALANNTATVNVTTKAPSSSGSSSGGGGGAFGWLGVGLLGLIGLRRRLHPSTTD